MKSKVYISKWTKDTIYCYQRGCVCKGCEIGAMIESQMCDLKHTVIELVKRFGIPGGKRNV